MSGTGKATRTSARNKTVVAPTTRITRTKTATPATPSTPTKKKAATTALAAASTSTQLTPRAVRKPLLARNTERRADSPKAPVKSKVQKTTTVTATAPTVINDSPKETIQAFLRIRPLSNKEDKKAVTCFAQSSESQARLTDPREDSGHTTRDYTFTQVFSEETTQSDVFQRSTLPLIRDALNGQNALLFAHGVTGSGKTFTMNGGQDEGSAGIIPRTFDVIFNSIRDLQGDFSWIPARLAGVEDGDKENIVPSLNAEEILLNVIPNARGTLPCEESSTIDETFLELDRNHRYQVFVSYAEVYNEKVYDLLTAIRPDGVAVTRKALALKNSPESEGVGRYVGNLSQFKVNSAAEAKALLRLGQLRRQVFGTLANRESSRSHAIAFVKVMQCHGGEIKNKDAVRVTRLTMVDLAGSERNKVTQTTGDRLREAANINKSLMVLGRCLHTLRCNQQRLAASLGIEEGRMDTREVRRRLSVVPYNNSTLTRILMDYFDSDGRTAMIVNVNPHGTSYDELAHVMGFAAMAQDVKVNATMPRRVTISQKSTLEIVEETDVIDDEYENDPLVDALFEDNEKLQSEVHFWKQKAYEFEQKVISVEIETRRDVMTVMRDKMARMEEQYSVRQRHLHEENERINDEKIDMLQEAGLLVRPAVVRDAFVDMSDEEEAMGTEDGDDDDDDDEDDEDEEDEDDGEDDEDSEDDWQPLT